MNKLTVTDAGVTLEIASDVDSEGEVEISLEGSEDACMCVWLDREKALKVANHLTEVFNL